MAYTILKSDGTPLTTIPDGTINTTSTSIGLPGRNYAGYGQTLDTNFVHQLENFANDDPPTNPLRGQLWFNTNDSTMYVCPTDGETNESNWLALTSTASGGTTTFGAVTVTGNTQANNFQATNNVLGNAASFNYLSVNTSANLASANITAANIGTLTTTAITTGSTSTPGTLTGAWTLNGLSSPGGNALVLNGNLYISNIGGGSYGIKTDNYYYANGVAISFAGTYTNANVAAYLPVYGGAISASTLTATAITSGGVGVAGTLTGLWSLVGSSRLQATYADLAERFEADGAYEPGTVVELGGEKEITAVKYELSEDVFGVVSDTAAYLMNSGAGDDKTHPPIAVSGRVKVKVTGKIKKGQRLVSAGNGIARGAKNSESNAFNTIGRSLENKTTDEIGTIEAIVIIK